MSRWPAPTSHVWVIGGDGDMLSIGGNHLIHALRRNVNLKILMFNNQIYGLTKGQYSPTSEVGKITKSTPFGSLDHPFNPISIALGAEASFVARTHDMDRKHMMEMFRRAHEHQGAAFVEVYQNCNVFNDGAFDTILNKDARPDMLIDLKHGEPIRFGADGELGVMMNEFGEAKIVEVADVGVDKLVVHDETRADPSLAFALSRLAEHPETPDAGRRVPRRRAAGVRRSMQQQLAAARRAFGSRRPRRAAALGADLDGRARPGSSGAAGADSVEGAEHHAGARLGPEERRLLRHAHAVDRPRRGCRRPTPASTGSRRRRRPCRRARRRRARRGGTATVASARRGTTSASMTAASVRGDGGVLAGERGGARVGVRGPRARGPRSSTRPSPPLGAHRGLERVDALGRVRAGGAHVERVGEAGPQVGARRAASTRRWIGSMQSSSSASSTTNVMIASAPPGRDARGAQLVAVVERGLEAVMAVGEHQRRARRPRRGSRRWSAGSSMARERVADAVVVDARGRAAWRRRAAR